MDQTDARRVREAIAGQGSNEAIVLDEPLLLDPGQPLRINRRLRQLQNLPPTAPIVATAVGSGLLTQARVRVLQRAFPHLRLVFLASNPMVHAWRSAGESAGASTHALYESLSRRQSLRKADQSSGLAACMAVFGTDRLWLFPAELLEVDAAGLAAALLGLARREPQIRPVGLPSGGGAALAGLQDSLRSLLLRKYGPLARKLAALAQLIDQRYDDWGEIARGWEESVRRSPLPDEVDRALLVVCGFRPSSRAMSSGQKLAQRRITQLAERFGRVDVVCFVNQLDRLDSGQGQETWPAAVGEVLEIRLTMLHRIVGMLRWPTLPAFVTSRRMALGRMLRGQRRQHTDFFADFSQGLGALPDSDYGLFAFRQHDIVSRLYERKASNSGGIRRLANQMEAWRARQWEARAWATVLRVETLSEDDATFVGDSTPAAEVFNGGAGVTIEVDPNQRRSEAIVPGRLIFWGNMSRAENVDAATYMARVLLPRIRARVAHAHLWIVGAHPTAEVEALRNDTVHVTGFVADPAPVFYTASAAVAPIRLGSGVKIKVLETIDAGIPTVASPVAREGIPPHDLLLAAGTDDEFVDLVCQALQKME